MNNETTTHVPVEESAPAGYLAVIWAIVIPAAILILCGIALAKVW